MSRLIAGLVTVAALIAMAVWASRGADPRPRGRPAKRVTVAGRPPLALPSPEPVVYADVAPDVAREINGQVPFSKAPNVPARPFETSLAGIDRQRALGCLAAAAWYEAGDDAVGEKAVVQVVLNRVRHPAFARSICGVVFAGSERTTGCQFTFACDGSLDRRTPPAAAWARARAIAAAGLEGTVFRPVGLATHYHTDWVVPYWSDSLDKITAVGTHLFYRWRGFWGTRAAFAAPIAPGEPAIVRLARLLPAEAQVSVVDVALDGVVGGEKTATSPPAASTDPLFEPVPGNTSVFLVTLPVERRQEFPPLATRACGKLHKCRFLVWTGARPAPTNLPLTARQQADLAFSYVRDVDIAFERTFWNCALVRDQPDCADARK